jgi:hypothetical protein
VVEQARKAETVQAIDRLRAVHTEKRKTVYILDPIRVDIEDATYPTTWFDITVWQETAPSSPAPA